MTRHIVIFTVCFLFAAVVTTALRAAGHDPYVAATPAVSAPAVQAGPATTVPVNTICSICGMPVDPALPTAVYQGKTIGFGCRACPPKFAKEPDRYGPSALLNRVVED